MTTLPNNWILAPLEECGDWGSGGTPKRTIKSYYEGGTIPWIIIGDLNDDIVTTSETHITNEGLQNSSSKLVPPDTLLIAMYGSIGKLGITGVECATNQAIAFCKPNSNLILVKYLFYSLMNARDDLITYGQGGTQQNISQSILRSYMIPLAPVNEQKRILEKLELLFSRLDQCREHLERIPLILFNLRQEIHNAAICGVFVENDVTEKIEKLPLSKIITRIKTGPFGSMLHKSDYITHGIPIINPMHINEGVITPSTNMTISENKANELSEYRLIPGDVVLARRGVMGRCAVVGEKEKGWLCGSGSMILHPTKQVLPEYLQLFLSSPFIVKTLVSDSVGSTMSNLNQQILLGLMIRVPRIEIQENIIRNIKILFAIIDSFEVKYKVALNYLDNLKPKILAQAFRGELSIQDPNDKPALNFPTRTTAEVSNINEKQFLVKHNNEVKMADDLIERVIQNLPNDDFSFEDLRYFPDSDYEEMKDVIFRLLEGPRPEIVQLFDQKTHSIRFRRSNR